MLYFHKVKIKIWDHTSSISGIIFRGHPCGRTLEVPYRLIFFWNSWIVWQGRFVSFAICFDFWWSFNLTWTTFRFTLRMVQCIFYKMRTLQWCKSIWLWSIVSNNGFALFFIKGRRNCDAHRVLILTVLNILKYYFD